MKNNHREIANEWFERAEHNFGIAKLAIDTNYWGDVICFDCHQAIKSI